MSWTYDPALLDDPTDGPLMQVRLLIGDTDTTDQQLQDEEIEFILDAEGGDVNRAAARCCETLASKYARQVDKKMGDLSIKASDLAKHYLELAKKLAGTSVTYATPSAGGIERSDRDQHQADESVIHGHFRRGMHDFQNEPIPSKR